MKKFHAAGIFMLFVFFTNTETFAQAKKYKVEGKKCMRTEITDPGEFYSTYDFEQSDLDMLKTAGVKDATIELVKKYHTEDAWPAQLGNFDVRIDNPDKIKTYVVYILADMGDKYLLVAPAKYNKAIGEGWAPAQDIYFVIGKVGVKS